MKVTWDKQKIADLLTSAFLSSVPQKKDKNTPPTTSIDILITFDASGVSSHPNHISLYHGSRYFVSSLMRDHSGWQSPVDIYTLTSISIFRKYTSFVDSILSLIFVAFGRREIGDHPSPLLFMSGVEGVRVAQKAMTTAHKSQMRWFRWGWIGMSRYMVVNDLKLEMVIKS